MSRLFAPAKVNLGLEIRGRRQDGYHLVQSLFWPIDFGDDLEISEANRNSVSMEWQEDAPRRDELPGEGENSVLRVLNKALEGTGKSWKVSIRKRIPVGGGLGGGSSDAGTVLRWLTQTGVLQELDAKKMAREIGADVAFFLAPKPCFISGVGEVCSYPEWASVPQVNFLLVFPQRGNLTREVFKQYDSMLHQQDSVELPSRREDLVDYLAVAKNHLETAAVAVQPEIGRILTSLRETRSLYCSVTGSGSTCVALYSTPQEREETLKVLQPKLRNNNWRSFKASSF